MSDLEMSKAEQDFERDQRNIRCEELQQVKDKLREEEETWTAVIM